MSETATADEAYVETQQQVETVSRILLGLDPDALAALIDRGQKSLDMGPIFHPPEFRAGADKLKQVLECTRALSVARRRIADAS